VDLLDDWPVDLVVWSFYIYDYDDFFLKKEKGTPVEQRNYNKSRLHELLGVFISLASVREYL